MDEPVNVNSTIIIQKRSPSGVVLSEEILPFNLNGEPSSTNLTITNVEWKLYSTYSPEQGTPPILNLDFLVDHCNNPPTQLCTLKSHSVSYGAVGTAQLGGVNPLHLGTFALVATSVDWQNDVIGIGGYTLKAIFTVRD